MEQNQDFFTLFLQNDEIKCEVLEIFLSDTFIVCGMKKRQEAGLYINMKIIDLMVVSEKPVDYGKKDK